MHILSSLDENYRVGHPVNILYLSRTDRDLVIGEAKRLGSMLNDENYIWLTESPTRHQVVAETQVVADEAKTISPYTALLLTRLHECFKVYGHTVDEDSAQAESDDLSTDAVVLRLEGTPKYVYVYVYNVMETPSLTYEAKIAKLQDLLNTLQTHSIVAATGDMDEKTKTMIARLELHSTLHYWERMLMADYVRIFGTVPPPFTSETVETVRKELSDLGFYGFVNPMAMYHEFTSSRVARKVSVDVEPAVIEFLSKVVRSGGGVV